MVWVKTGFWFGFTFGLYWFGLKQAKKAVGPVWFGPY
jgi:hypothetical protein